MCVCRYDLVISNVDIFILFHITVIIIINLIIKMCNFIFKLYSMGNKMTDNYY